MAALRSTEFWKLFPPELRPRAEPQPVAAGLSAARVWRCECPAGTFALKTLERRDHHEAQSIAAAALPFVPAPQRNLRGETATRHRDGLRELCGWRPGAPAANPFAVVAAAAAGLARWHRVFAGRTPSLPRDRVGTAAADRTAAWTVPPRCDGLLKNAGLEDAFRKLAPRMPQWLALCARPQPQVVCHGDPNRGNLLFQDGELTGLIDFAALRIDTPLLDLARWCGDAAPLDDDFRRATLAEYARWQPLPDDANAIAQAFEATGAVIGALRWTAALRLPDRADGALDSARARWTMLAGRVARLAERTG